MATTAYKVGVPDSAAGAGVLELLALDAGLAALIQAIGPIPLGDPWAMGESLSHTPTIITTTFPPHPVLAWRVPVGRKLLFTGGLYHALTAATDYVRVCRRYFLYGYQGTAAPAAPAAPTLALVAGLDGIGTSGVYSYKIAPINAFRQESAATAASGTVTLTSTNRGIGIVLPALPTGAHGYNIYRTLANGSTYYYVGTANGTNTYADFAPDSTIDQTKQPSATWATGAITGEAMDGPGEIIIESGTPAVTGAPTNIIYTGMSNGYSMDPANPRKMAQTTTFPTTIGQRIRALTYHSVGGFVAVPTATDNFWRGSFTTDSASRHIAEIGALSVTGFDTAPTAGSLMVWGQQLIGMSERVEATAAIKAVRIIPTDPIGAFIPPGGEIVCEIGALAAGVASVRDIRLFGRLFPTT